MFSNGHLTRVILVASGILYGCDTGPAENFADHAIVVPADSAAHPGRTDQPLSVPPVAAQPLGATAGSERSDNGLMMKLCWCPPGTFPMGSPPSEPGRTQSEQQITVTLEQGFWLGKNEVTQSQWTQVMATAPWKGRSTVGAGPDHPAGCINWDEATEFCHKLTGQEKSAGRLTSGWSYRLPAAAEWEYACRAGTTTAFCFGNNESQLGDYAWYDKNTNAVGERYSHGTGLKKPNAWGLHDMHGNLFEWCQDWQAAAMPEVRQPFGPAEGEFKILRGGGWIFAAIGCRSSIMAAAPTKDVNGMWGFRVALSPSR